MARTQRSTRRITIWAELLMLAIGAVSPLSAAVLTNNIVYGPKFGSDAIYQVTQPGPNGLFALSVIINQPGQFTIGYSGIAELFSVHSASFGLEFTPSYVRSDAPLLNNLNNPGSFQLSLGLGESVLLAYWDDYYGNFPNPSSFGIPDEYDGYGWFRLTRTLTGLKVLDSATAIGGGIVVGTYTQIPEPTIVKILALAVVGILALGRRLKQRSPANDLPAPSTLNA